MNVTCAGETVGEFTLGRKGLELTLAKGKEEAFLTWTKESKHAPFTQFALRDSRGHWATMHGMIPNLTPSPGLRYGWSLAEADPLQYQKAWTDKVGEPLEIVLY